MTERIVTMHSGKLSWRTAIKRSKLSKPAQVLQSAGWLEPRLLDYGCGRGDDADQLGCERYDPHFYPDHPTVTFTTIMCNYVLNVVECEYARRTILHDISGMLSPDGRAYIAVRINKKTLKGMTKIGTWQGLIVLDLPIVYKDSCSIIYAMNKDDLDCTKSAETFPV
jgi:hypothetical protein